MSRRLNISGFSLPKLLSLSGCKKAAVVLSLQALADNPEIIKRYIMEAGPFPDLLLENHAHTQAARILAGFNQDHTATDSNFFSLEDWSKFLSKFKKKANPELDVIFKFLEEGRPLFGQGADRIDSYYAYLTNAELGLLLQYIKPAKIKKTILWDPEYMEKLLATGQISQWDYDQEKRGLADSSMISFEKAFALWCKNFYDSGQDLWLVCA